MISRSVARVRQPVRTLVLDPRAAAIDEGEARSFGLAGRSQVALTAGLAFVTALTAAATLSAVSQRLTGSQAVSSAPYYPGLSVAPDMKIDRTADLIAQKDDFSAVLAADAEQRRISLTSLLTELQTASKGAAAPEAAATKTLANLPISPLGQKQMLDDTAQTASNRGERLRMALKLTGLNPAKLGANAGGVGGPLIEASNPRALAAILDVDEGFAARIQKTARAIGVVNVMEGVAARLPLAIPVSAPVKSSGFGYRSDPFTGAAAFHAGQDFSGGYMSAIGATGPGIVSFTGERSGYGNAVEIDHGGGFKTRYGHLAAINVRVGQPVVAGQRLGGMGSTGRSTGVHLHYEVWVNGVVQDPSRFLRAGQLAAVGEMSPQTATMLAVESHAHGARAHFGRRGGRVHGRYRA